MLLSWTLIALVSATSYAPTVTAVPAGSPAVTARAAAPSVVLDQGTFIGDATTTAGVDRFLGIPFAEPPVGNLRFALPVANPPYNATTHTVTSFGPACFQQDITLPLASGLAAEAVNWIINSVYAIIEPAAEDCLTINVWRPSGTTSSSKLPVLAWIFGGGFELGAPAMYDGGSVVQKSITNKTPIVFVSMNYRVSGFGFLASKEVKAAGVGNLGLQDQREALRWIQKYISVFGGDPTKVTIQGESAGAISVGLQMVTNGGDTEGLFRGGFMQSGSPIPVGDITHGQRYYDQIVSYTGCSGASDTLACLRTVSYANLSAAINTTPSLFAYQSLELAWLPRVDGVFLTEPPFNLVASGSVASIPFVTGDCDDEGTLFSLANLNVTTDAEFSTYLQQAYIPSATAAQLAQVATAYPEDITQGSPFDTGILNALTPEYKRLAAVQGDLVFQAPRRWFLQHRSALQPTWSFLYKRNKDLPDLGTVHGSDISAMFGTGSGTEMQDYAINFATNLNPNGPTVSSPAWPQWTNSSPTSLMFLDGLIPLTLTPDTYRQAPMDLLNTLAYQYPI